MEKKIVEVCPNCGRPLDKVNESFFMCHKCDKEWHTNTEKVEYVVFNPSRNYELEDGTKIQL